MKRLEEPAEGAHQPRAAQSVQGKLSNNMTKLTLPKTISSEEAPDADLPFFLVAASTAS
jgi:hypothetical protein